MPEEDLVEEYVSSVRQGGFEAFLPSPRLQFRYRQKLLVPSLRVLESGRISYFSGFVKHDLGAGALIWVYEKRSFKLCDCKRLCWNIVSAL